MTFISVKVRHLQKYLYVPMKGDSRQPFRCRTSPSLCERRTCFPHRRPSKNKKGHSCKCPLQLSIINCKFKIAFLVLAGGLEPPRAVSPLPPQDSVSANSTTPAGPGYSGFSVGVVCSDSGCGCTGNSVASSNG